MKKALNFFMFLLIIPIIAYSMSLDQATFQVGKKFFSQNLFSEAEMRFLDIVSKYPDSPYYRQSLFYLGQTYSQQGKYKSALQYYKVLLNNSRTVQERQSAILGVAKSWLQLGSHDKAAQFYSFYAAEYPESEHAPTSLYFAGIAREREDKIDAAVENYRAVISQYPRSDFYAKAIEKVAVLESNTPEELFAAASAPPTRQSAQVELFADDEFDMGDVPGMDTGFKAQSFVNPIVQPIPATPSVITQVIVQQPATPLVITQQVAPAVITQTLVVTQQVSSPPVEIVQPDSNPQVSPSETESLIAADIVRISNNQYIPVETPEQQAKRKELDAYRKIWEEEFKAKQRNEQLDQTQIAIRELLQLTENKAQVLATKEAGLVDQQNELRSSLYQELEKIKNVQSVERFDTPPSFTRNTNIVTVTNTVNLADSQTPQPIVSPATPQPTVDTINQAAVVDEALAPPVDGEYGADPYAGDYAVDGEYGADPYAGEYAVDGEYGADPYAGEYAVDGEYGADPYAGEYAVDGEYGADPYAEENYQ